MRTILCLLFANFLLESLFIPAVIGIPTEDLETHLTFGDPCNGPGSNPFTNLVFNGRCNCKRNVKGKFCSECKPKYFGLNTKIQHGCLRCFCSGRTTVCESSNWFRKKIQVPFNDTTDRVELVYQNMTSIDPSYLIGDEGELIVDDLPMELNETYYWKLPQKMIGDKLTSYGGFLNFTIDYEVYKQRESNKWLNDPLVLMSGNGFTIYHRFRKRYRRTDSHYIPLMENIWRFEKGKTNGSSGIKNNNRRQTIGNKKNGKVGRKKKRRVRRKEFMTILANVDYILVKANYRSGTKKVSLVLLSMSDASPRQRDSSEPANEVEKCDCPPGYGGLSCQTCALGFTISMDEEMTRDPASSLTDPKRRSASKPNRCRPCNCNGHSSKCHEVTGRCLDCKHNTVGEYCQHSLVKCDPKGTLKQINRPGAPSQCMCKVGVTGHLCNKCKRGYFHLDQTNEIGCRKCWCNGVTFDCSSSSLRRFQLRIQPPAFINMGFFDGKNGRMWAKMVSNGRATFNFKKYDHFSNFYWSLPKKFTGNLLKSYGGNLNFSLYHIGLCERMVPIEPFVELQSFSGDYLTWKFSPKPIMNSPVRFSVHLSEEHFFYYGTNVERGLFLRVLSSLRALRVYIPRCHGLDSTEISNVIMDTGVNWASDLPIASEVEECRCPKGYSGLSCENCSSGYVRHPVAKRCIPKQR